LSLVRGDPAPWIARIESLPFVEPNTQEQLCHTALIDVTEQRKLEVKLRELTADLERRVAERTALAEERASQIQALAAELTQAEQHERDRVADLVHDNLQQLLIACRMRLSILARKAAKTERSELIADVSSLLKQAIAATRSLSVQLSPPVLPGENLVLSLRWLSDWMKANHELRVDLSLAAEAEPVQPATRLVCFQAVRELLLNVAKHAKVDQASVSMGLDSAGNTQITVRDEGAGYDPATPQNAEGSALGAGLAYLRRKLYLAGGQIDIESRPGHGTCARLRIPLHRGRPTTTDR
jgi:signal transduction histidine kinase